MDRSKDNELTLITLASKNEGKRYELEQQLQASGLPYRLVLNESAEDVEETGTTFIENAWLKAEQTPPAPGSEWVLAEDSGFAVAALDGLYGHSPFPGLHTNRWMTPDIRRELLGIDSSDRVIQAELSAGIQKLLAGNGDRRAAYLCGMVLYHTRHGRMFETLGETPLVVLESGGRGDKGFGYDPIVCPVRHGQVDSRTMAELETDEKNSFSHRGQAFSRVLEWLGSAGNLS